MDARMKERYWGCYNRPPADIFKGNRKDCAYAYEFPDDPRCADCRWNTEARLNKEKPVMRHEEPPDKAQLPTKHSELYQAALQQQHAYSTLQKELNEAKIRIKELMAIVFPCETCGGLGRVDDAEPGDIYYKSMECPDCSGFNVNDAKRRIKEDKNGI